MAGVDRARKGLDEVLVLALASGATLAEAAARARVSERTARRRVSDPEFAATVEALRADLVERATGRLLACLDDALATITDVMTSGGDSVRLRAACAVLDQALALRRASSLERRLLAIEAAADGQGRSV